MNSKIKLFITTDSKTDHMMPMIAPFFRNWHRISFEINLLLLQVSRNQHLQPWILKMLINALNLQLLIVFFSLFSKHYCLSPSFSILLIFFFLRHRSLHYFLQNWWSPWPNRHAWNPWSSIRIHATSKTRYSSHFVIHLCGIFKWF